MEFEIDVQHGLNGHVEITDYSKEYDQYYAEDASGMTSSSKFKYSESKSLNVIIRVNTGEATLVDVLLDDHDQDLEQTVFDVDQDGYFTVTHFVLPNALWMENQMSEVNNLISNYSVIYYIDGATIYKRTVTSSLVEDTTYKYILGNPEEVTVRELLERNVEGTTIQKCQIDIFYTGYLQECYINHCKELLNGLMKHCRPNCTAKEVDVFPRDFLWMTINVLDYLVERGQFNEAQRILEEINYCGGFCNSSSNNVKSVCGCSQGNS